MGRKGVSKRKPKTKIPPFSGVKIGGKDNAQPAAQPGTVASIPRGREIPFNKSGMNPNAGANKAHNKR
jgi:hypothetical protein